MLAKPFVGPIGKGELEIPAVRGVSGSLIYFIERPDGRGTFFDVDFVPDPEPEQPPDLGLVRIDHVAQVVPEAELVSWVLYYRTILGLEPSGRTDLPDPHGLIVSRAMTNEERTLRIALNVSQAERTRRGPLPAADRRRWRPAHRLRLPRHLRRRGRAARRAQAARARELLRGPRRAVRSRRCAIARMRDLAILYDRIGAGEFFQVFTRSINGVFFEIVERRNYDRYGEANAPVRLAAQAALDRSAAEIMTALRG